MLRSALFLLLVPIALSSQITQEEIKPYDDAEVYNVYSALLSLEKSTSAVLISDTTVPFNNCLHSDLDKLVNAAIEDYKQANQTRWRLGYHFQITRPYKLLSEKKGSGSPKADNSQRQESTAPEGIHRFSAVGFSADKSIAFVEMDIVCGGLCGHGSPYILQKREGKWVRYTSVSAENTAHSHSIPGATGCGWFY
jgi:hypothetical protein